MIIELLLSCIQGLLDTLLVFEIPTLPPEVLEYVQMFFDYLVLGASVLGNYVNLPYLMTLFGILLAVDAGILIYKFVMWILQKIPIVDID